MWILTATVCFVMAVINIHSLTVQIFESATSTEIDVVRNEAFRFPNITYCFDGLPELGPDWNKAQFWAPYSNTNVDGPAWYHALTPFIREEMATLARIPHSHILEQNWTFYSFLYIEAYFRLEVNVLIEATDVQPWVAEFGDVFLETFRPYNVRKMV